MPYFPGILSSPLSHLIDAFKGTPLPVGPEDDSFCNQIQQSLHYLRCIYGNEFGLGEWGQMVKYEEK